MPAERDLDAVQADVRASGVMKAEETHGLREQSDLAAVGAAAAALRGRRVLAFNLLVSA